MKWSDVGDWVQNNAGAGAALVGSLLTGNIPGAVASGIAMVTNATGYASPESVLSAFQTDPNTIVKLKELALKNEDSIRKHTEEMVRLELEDAQKAHEVTQKTIINSDNSQDRLVRWTRPLQSWASLVFAGFYVFSSETVEMSILGLLLTLPWSYAGLRQIGKWGDSKHTAVAMTGVKVGRDK